LLSIAGHLRVMYYCVCCELLPWVMQRAWRGAPYLARSRSLSRSAQEFIYPRAAELSKSQSAAVGLRITKCFALLSYLQFISIRTKGIVFAHDERFTFRKNTHSSIHVEHAYRLILLYSFRFQKWNLIFQQVCEFYLFLHKISVGNLVLQLQKVTPQLVLVYV
jgi:hypothetical protein